jgi:hypothetical protein
MTARTKVRRVNLESRQMSGDRMTKLKGWIAAPATVGLLLVAGCENIPYYNDSLNWFSWSRYDPEVKTIEREIPPPGELQAPPTAGKQAAVRDARGGYVLADPPPGATVTLGATPLVSMNATANSARVADASSGSNPSTGAPLVGIRNSVPGSVTWRSARGTP